MSFIYNLKEFFLMNQLTLVKISLRPEFQHRMISEEQVQLASYGQAAFVELVGFIVNSMGSGK
jgi:hypothetical protein